MDIHVVGYKKVNGNIPDEWQPLDVWVKNTGQLNVIRRNLLRGCDEDVSIDFQFKTYEREKSVYHYRNFREKYLKHD